MPLTTLHLRTRRPIDYGTTPGSTTITRRGRNLLRRYANVVMGALGNGQDDTDYVLGYTASDPATANASVALGATTTGTIGCTINGVSVTAAVSDDVDAASAGIVAAAINASTDPLVLGHVKATNLSATVTLASVAAGDTVNICGYRFTAVSGTPGKLNVGDNLFTFDISGTNTQDAAALCAAINAAPGLSRWVYATCGTTTAGVVRIFARQATEASGVFTWPTGPNVPPNRVISLASTMTVSTATLAAAAWIGITAVMPGISGNTITLAVTGTGPAIDNSEARLARGVGVTSLVVIDDASGGA